MKVDEEQSSDMTYLVTEPQQMLGEMQSGGLLSLSMGISNISSTNDDHEF